MFKTTALDSVANAYVDKNVGASIPGTRLEADDRNIMQDELVNAVEGTGQTLDPTGANKSQVLTAITSAYVVDASETDQGVTGNSRTIKAFVDIISSDKATILLRHAKGSAQTAFTLTTSETIPSNITLERENGAILDGAGTLTINGPFKSDLSKAFGSSIDVKFGNVGEVYPQWWGAVGNGVADDTAAIQAALDTERDVFFSSVNDPATEYYRLTAALTLSDKQKLSGSGSKSIIRQTTSLENVIEGSGVDNCTLDNLHLYSVGDVSDADSGCGAYFYNCNYITVKNCTFENCKSQGVLFDDVTESVISKCIFINSPTADDDENGDSGTDIRLQDNCNDNLIIGNACISGNFGGICVYTRYVEYGGIAGDSCRRNRIIDNVIKNARGYGIWLYRAEETSQDVTANIISNNIVHNITGTILNSVGSVYDFGTGIYIQGAEHTIISNNRISDTHSGSVAHTESLGPGAIAAVNMSNVMMSMNSIANAGMHGIYLKDSNNWGLADGKVMVRNTSLEDSALDGIHIRSLDNVSIINNSIEDSGSLGIEKDNEGDANKNYIITDNIIRNTNSRGIQIIGVNNVLIENNIVEITTISSAIHAELLNNVIISNNIATGVVANAGIYVNNDCTHVTISDNIVYENDVGMKLFTRCILSNNIVHTNTTDWYATGFNPIRKLDNNGTPSVALGKTFLTGDTTTVTDFNDGIEGQIIQIIAEHTKTITDGTNIFLNGSGDFVMAATDTLTLICKADNKWYELARSDNT